MRVLWTDQALEDYAYWEKTDAKAVERIRDLIEDIKANPFTGLGKPEPLKYDLAGWWSRRITMEHRLVYRVEGKPTTLTIGQCRYHYE
jgi:toxin YoeB